MSEKDILQAARTLKHHIIRQWIAELPAPDQGLGFAILDTLTRQEAEIDDLKARLADTERLTVVTDDLQARAEQWARDTFPTTPVRQIVLDLLEAVREAKAALAEKTLQIGALQAQVAHLEIIIDEAPTP